MIEEYVGSHYNRTKPKFTTIVNLLNQAAEAHVIDLVTNCPRCRVTTEDRRLWPFAYRFQTALNNFIQEMKLEETLAAIALDGFFSLGVAKVYQRDYVYVQLDEDVWADPGKPYVSRVSLDDLVLDMSVGSLRRCKFMGDRYRVAWSKVRDNPDFDSAIVKQLGPTSKYGRTDTQEKTQEIGSREIADGDELEPMIDLWDCWIPELNVVATFAWDTVTLPLVVRECGSEGGPYHFLRLGDVPDNIMPSTAGQNLKELHDLYNGLFRKMAAQAKRHKVNPVYRPGTKDDAERLKRVNDGEWVQVQDPTGISTIEQGGIVPTNAAFAVAVESGFDRQAGNLQARLGLGPQAGTLGQEELIQGVVSKKAAKDQYRVNAFTEEVLEHVGHLMWHDAMLEVPGQVEAAPGTGVYVDASWSPDRREGDFWQYQFKVQPYSMAYQPPGAKWAKLQQAIMMILQLLQARAQGAPIDVAYAVKLVAELQDIPELENLYAEIFPIEQPEGGEGPSEIPGVAAPREYIRRNVSMGGTPQARQDQMQQSMMQLAGSGSRASGQQMNQMAGA